jgi:hypothetical protein
MRINSGGEILQIAVLALALIAVASQHKDETTAPSDVVLVISTSTVSPFTSP